MSESVLVSPHIITSIEKLRARLGELNATAESLCQKHFDFVMAENKKKDWDDKSVLFVQSRLRDNTMSVTWYVVRWYGSKAMKTRRMVKKVIVKPRIKYSYNMETMRNKSQPWEFEMVQETEQAVMPIRREVWFISKVLTSLNKISKNGGES